MNRITHDVQQGTGPWLRLREGFYTASEAPAALGVSRYVTRADLLRRKHTGVAEEHSQATLAKFRAGHESEALARPMAEQTTGDLYPVTMSVEVAGLKLLASLDGLTLDGEICWETKLWNEQLAQDVRNGTLAEHYTVQMDQELFVSGAKRCLFTCTDGTPERFVSCWYEASEERFDALLSGWLQFDKDLAVYKLPEAAAPEPVGKAPETLPALRIEVTGEVTASNLAEFKSTALAAIRSVNRDLRTDQDFADAEKAVKWCGDVESRLKAAKDHALSQTASIDALFKAIDDISAEAKRVRLDLDKLVARRKTEVKEEAVAAARRALDQHIAAVNAEIAPMQLPQAVADFAGAIKGLRSVASMQDALDQVLTAAKIAADAQARGIRANAAAFEQLQLGQDYGFLFRDLHQLVHKPADDFAAVVRSRIAEHQLVEARREAERKAAEDARIAAAEQRAREDEAKRIAAQQAAEAAAVAAQAAAAAPAVVVAPAAVVPVAAPVQVVAVASTQAQPPRADEPATLKLGAICERLGITMTAAFVAEVLGVQPARTDGSARLYRDSDFTRICARLQQHVGRVAVAHQPDLRAA